MITLRIASNATVSRNAYKQPYFDRSSEKPIYILQAYVAKEYKEEDIEEIPSALSTAMAVYQVARDTYYEEIKNTE